MTAYSDARAARNVAVRKLLRDREELEAARAHAAEAKKNHEPRTVQSAAKLEVEALEATVAESERLVAAADKQLELARTTRSSEPSLSLTDA